MYLTWVTVLATDKIRKKDKTAEMRELEKSLTETLGTRVMIENRQNGGRVLIEFFSPEDLTHIVAALAAQQGGEASIEGAETITEKETPSLNVTLLEDVSSVPASPSAPSKKEEEDLYSVQNFTV